MKFSEIEENSWPELQPYLDTCLLPLSGMTGEEAPWEATNKIASAGRWLAPLEQAFRGRTVTMPAYHYGGNDEDRPERMKRLIASMKGVGFRYVVVVSGQTMTKDELLGADLFVGPVAEGEEPEAHKISKSLADLWRKPVAATE
ncbi:DUF2487 family protein [Cohnella endophytica]|nr:DUF2487 family protein [Cohnella endophytica]